MKNPSVYDCSVIELPKINDRAGNITPVHGNREIPFEINEAPVNGSTLLLM